MQFKLPELGEGVHEGELIKWNVKPGDSVNYDQSLCEIMTDKATIEIPSAFKGTVKVLDVKEGQVVHVGQVMCTFEGGEAKAGATASTSSTASAPAPAMSAAPVSKTSAPNAAVSTAGGLAMELNPATRALAAPSTRKAAREMGIDLSHIQGSGPNGRIMKDDLTSGEIGTSGTGATAGKGTFIAPAPYRAPVAPGTLEERVPFRGLRKKIAEKMHESKSHAAHFTYVEEADMTELVALRLKAKEMGLAQGVKVTFLPFLMKAMVAALRKYPILNSQLDEAKGELIYKHYYNIALSVQTEDGLMAPVIKDVANKTIFQLAHDIEQIANRARTKKLTMDDLTGGTITITNAGTIGGLFATPVINYPEVAIMGFNKIARKPVVKVIDKKEQIVIRDWTYFSMSLDHRVVDGAIGAEFMKLFISYIENPALLVMEM